MVRHLLEPEALVSLRLDVDFLLGTQERAEVASDVLYFGIRRDEEAHDEGGIDELAEAELLEHVVLTAPDIGRLDASLEHAAQAVVGPAGKVQRDLIPLKKRFEALDRRVVTAGVEADRDLNAGQLGRLPVRRVCGHEDP